jgi:hypothetical protein
MRQLSALVLALVACGLGQPEREVLPRQERRFDRHLQEVQRRDGEPILIQYFEDSSDEDHGNDEEVTLTSKENSSDMYDGDLEEGDLKEHPSSVLGLVPQLWPNYTEPAEQPAEEVSCDEARLKCVFRAGCGVALQNYVVGCGDLTSGKSRGCNAHCRNALTALMSTPEGFRLMKVTLFSKSTSKIVNLLVSFCRWKRSGVKRAATSLVVDGPEDKWPFCWSRTRALRLLRHASQVVRTET